jgi:Ca-activated chloride channel family protein
MKIRTVGALAALGMLLTSYSVWSLTDDSALARTRGASHREPLVTETNPPAVGASEASFSAGGTLRLAARLGHSRLPRTGDETFVLMNVRADANAGGSPAQRELVIAIDRSGSMSGKRLANAVAAAEGAVERLADGNSVSVIDYSNAAHLLVAPTVLGSGTRSRVERAIATLSAGGETCISCALETALELSRSGTNGVERVLLLSDGEATTGVRDVDGLRRIGDRLRRAGATVTTIGVDVDYNERIMTSLAQAANGHHYFVASPEGLPAIFDRELTGLERTVAREAKVELELAPGVELVDVADHAFERDGARVAVALGSFAAGEERSVLVRVRVAPAAAGERPIATTRLRYDDLATGARSESHGELVATLTDDGSRSPLDSEVAERVERSGAAAALNDANDLFNAGDAAGARERIAKKLAEVRRGRAFAVAAAPAPEKAKLSARFDAQESALGSAATGFAEPPPSREGRPADARPGKIVVKENAARAAELTF